MATEGYMRGRSLPPTFSARPPVDLRPTPSRPRVDLCPANIGPTWANVGPPSGQDKANVVPTPAKIGPTWAKIAQYRATWSNIGAHRAKVELTYRQASVLPCPRPRKYYALQHFVAFGFFRSCGSRWVEMGQGSPT